MTSPASVTLRPTSAEADSAATFGFGKDATAQWKDEASCKNACAAFPQGTAGATDGNSLECRAYHAGKAGEAGMAATHCPHAGPTGGDQDVSDTNAGACGEGCEAFCALGSEFAQWRCLPITSEVGTQKLCLIRIDTSHFNQEFFINF